MIFLVPVFIFSSTVNQLLLLLTRIRTHTTLPPQQRRLQLPLTKVVTRLVVALDLAALLAALAIGAPRSEVRDVLRHLPDAPLMRLLYVFQPTIRICMLSYFFKQAPNPSSVLGVFGLSIRTTERDLDEEFTRFGHVEKVTIVYDQRVCRALCPDKFSSDLLSV